MKRLCQHSTNAVEENSAGPGIGERVDILGSAQHRQPCTQQELLYIPFAVGHIFRYYSPEHTLVTTDMQGMFAIFLLLCYVTCTTSDVFSSIYQLETLVAMETDLVSCLRDLSTVNETLGHTDDVQRYDLHVTI